MHSHDDSYAVAFSIQHLDDASLSASAVPSVQTAVPFIMRIERQRTGMHICSLVLASSGVGPRHVLMTPL